MGYSGENVLYPMIRYSGWGIAILRYRVAIPHEIPLYPIFPLPVLQCRGYEDGCLCVVLLSNIYYGSSGFIGRSDIHERESWNRGSGHSLVLVLAVLARENRMRVQCRLRSGLPYDVPHFCALPTPISHTLVWEIQGRNINLARAFPSCKKN
jgi:hypothetical protein